MTKPMQEPDKQEVSAVISSEMPGHSAPAVSSASSFDSGLQTDDSSLSSPESTAISTPTSKDKLAASCSTDILNSTSVFVPTLSSASCYTDTSISSQLERELLAHSSSSCFTDTSISSELERELLADTPTSSQTEIEPTANSSISSNTERELLAVSSKDSIVKGEFLAHTYDSVLLIRGFPPETSIGSLKVNGHLAPFSILLQRQLLADACIHSHAEGKILATASISSHAERELLADASLSSHTEKESLADASLSSHTERELLADTSISSHTERELLAEASISPHTERELLADVSISSHAERELQADVSLSSHTERELLADASLSSHTERELQADSSISSHAERELLADASISSHLERELQGDAFLSSHTEKEFQADASISSHAERQLLADTSISSHTEKEFQADASISSHLERELLADASLSSHTEKEFQADASISSHAERELLADTSISSHAERELLADASISFHAERELLADASLSSHADNELLAGTSSDAQSPDVRLHAIVQGSNGNDQVCEKGVSGASDIGKGKRPVRILYLSAFDWDRFSLEHPSDISSNEDPELESGMLGLGINSPDGHMSEGDLGCSKEESVFLEHLTESGRGKGRRVKPRSCLEPSPAEKDNSVNVYLHTSDIQNGVYVRGTIYYEPIPSTSTGITPFGIIDPSHGPSERNPRGTKKGAKIKRSRSSLDSNPIKRSPPKKTNKLKKDKSSSQPKKPRKPCSSCKKPKVEAWHSPVNTGQTQSPAAENVNTENMDRSLSPIQRLSAQKPPQVSVNMSRTDRSRSPVIKQAKQSSPRRKAFMRSLERSRSQQNRRPRPSLFRRIQRQGARRERRPLSREPFTRRNGDNPAIDGSEDFLYPDPSLSETESTQWNSVGRERMRAFRQELSQSIGLDVQENLHPPRSESTDIIPTAVGKTAESNHDLGTKSAEEEPKPGTSTSLTHSKGSSETFSSQNTASAIRKGAQVPDDTQQASPCSKRTLTPAGVDDTNKEEPDNEQKPTEDEPIPSTSTGITDNRGYEKPPIPFDVVVIIQDSTCQSRPKYPTDSLQPAVDNTDEIEYDEASSWESDYWSNNETDFTEETDDSMFRERYREHSPLSIERAPRRKRSRIGERRRRSRSRERKSQRKQGNGKRRRSSSSSDREEHSSCSNVSVKESGSSSSDDGTSPQKSKRGKRRRRSRSPERKIQGSSSLDNAKEACSSSSDETKSRPTPKRRTYRKRRRSSSSPDEDSSSSSSSDNDLRRQKKKRRALQRNEDGSYICPSDCPCKGNGTGRKTRKIRRRFRVEEDLCSLFLRSRSMDPTKQTEDQCCERNCSGQWPLKMVNSAELLREYI